MDNSREELQSLLESILGSRNVYYQSPENIKMNYPAIRYKRKKPDSRFANNSIYFKKQCYEIIVIDREPDNEVIEKISSLPYCSVDQNYISDNLHHDVFTIYY